MCVCISSTDCKTAFIFALNCVCIYTDSIITAGRQALPNYGEEVQQCCSCLVTVWRILDEERETGECPELATTKFKESGLKKRP